MPSLVSGKQVKIITFGVIKLFKEENQALKLKEIFLQVQEIIESYLPKYLAH